MKVLETHLQLLQHKAMMVAMTLLTLVVQVAVVVAVELQLSVAMEQVELAVLVELVEHHLLVALRFREAVAVEAEVVLQEVRQQAVVVQVMEELQVLVRQVQ